VKKTTHEYLGIGRNKKAVDLIVYRPVGGAGQHQAPACIKAGASGWAVNRSPQDVTKSAVCKHGGFETNSA
jgi:hypothetical protein